MDAGLLIGGIDGKVQLVESGALKPVSGARDWGSDFAALHSGCGAGAQILLPAPAKRPPTACALMNCPHWKLFQRARRWPWMDRDGAVDRA